MTLKEIKAFFKRLPTEMDEFDVVNGEVGYIDIEDDDSLTYRVDKPIITLYVDEDTKEICFLHQTQEDINEINNHGTSKGTK